MAKRSKKDQRARNKALAKTTARKKAIKAAEIALDAKLTRVGRPTKFKAEYVEQAYQLTLLGLTLEEMAKVFDVTVETIHEWKNGVEEFSNAIKRGGAIADGMVTDSLFQNAIGHAGEKIFYDHQSGEIVRAPTRHKPDPVSGIFWLKNRQPHIWRDRHDFTSSDGSFTAFKDSAVDESRALEKNLRKETNGANGHDKSNGHSAED